MSKLFFLGDSITAGAWDPKGGWAARVIGEIMRMNIEANFEGFYCLPYNLGVSGDQIPELLKRMDAEIDARIWKEDNNDVAEIVIYIGVNDSIIMVDEERPAFSEDEFSKNVKTLLEKAKALSIHVTVLGLLPVIEKLVNPMPWAPNKAYENERVRIFENILKQNCEALKVDFFPLFDRWSQLQNLKDVLIDGVHPSEKGHELLANEVKNYLLNDAFINRHKE